MKFGPLPLDEARGATAVHAIRKGEVVLKKGAVITDRDIAALRAAGIAEVVVARLDPGDVPEDVAAAKIAAALVDETLSADRAFTGRCNLFARHAGVLVVDKGTVDTLNRVDESVTLATLPAFKPVVAGEMVATVKIIPFAVPEKTCADALSVAARARPVLRIAPYRVRR
ncbi:MAG: 4-diphosphocytidyl-2C-methyl-D-erythritol kinase, partial [Pseudorhodoplanes sp.]|nr:4-diphosphocytidyl-2C-methyl-D-erythritol kinase [Pseudorhodoplanes sp.]